MPGVKKEQLKVSKPASTLDKAAVQEEMVASEQTQRLAQPDNMDKVGINSWYMDSSDADQRAQHKLEGAPAVPASKLRELGVLCWKLDPATYETDPRLKAIREARGYSYQDLITVSPEKLPGYEQKLKSFFEEHLHTDEEIRYILEGSGYFDVRDFDDKWIRIECKTGDMITLPEGIYHRFTLDETNYIKALRLFVGEPVWTPVNRPQDEHPSRKKYVEEYVAPAVAAH